jgi:predicted transcriptional regulator
MGMRESSDRMVSSLRLTRCMQVAVGLIEWEAFPLQFEGSSNYREKSFYKLLTGKDGIVSMVTEVMKVIIATNNQVLPTDGGQYRR